MLRKLKLSQHRHGGDSSYIMYTSTPADSWGQLRKTLNISPSYTVCHAASTMVDKSVEIH